MEIPRLVIAAAQRGTGKSTVATGLIRALTNRGLSVQPYKKGPDYLDPMWLSLASRTPCYNVDTTIFETDVSAYLAQHSRNASISIIEGNQGLHDSPSPDGDGSTADLARRLRAPVILVMDTAGSNRTVAAIVKGLIEFDPEVNISGIILNNVRGSRHTEKIITAIDIYVGVPVLGSLPKTEETTLEMRHLGLIPATESGQAEQLVSSLAKLLESSVDIDKLVEIARKAPTLDISPELSTVSKVPVAKKFKIGIAKDEAFNFYYPDNFEALENLGAELVFFSPLKDDKIPAVSALYLGGGFPEVFAEQLSLNKPMLQSMKQAIETNLPVYAECGGLIYLSNAITHEDTRHELVAALPLEFTMTAKSQARGYVHLRVLEYNNKETLWRLPPGALFRGHEFHYTKALPLSKDISFAYSIERGFGLNGNFDGLLYKNVLAGYVHLHTLSASWWAGALARVALEYQNNVK
ncbi:MAG: cobyrinate a,c-diamide synthase [Leptospirales bacterium]